ncbi:hypothetical protein BDN72DRAFT_848202 [Pluteus cervinus]|uniref:Uncharacterized protein n=1 Tax=Pluteus cervinus TaxID=181527 RepID=A0ACD3AB58_9AGAR|nr:hypothetical protein BDN72DRAFT_848202 [Pluteus cervinus]
MALTTTTATYEALLIGGFFAAALSGIILLQARAYFWLFPRDAWQYKTLVFTTWVLDVVHMGFVMASVWTYFLDIFNAGAQAMFIPKHISVTIWVSAASSFLSQFFHIHNLILLENLATGILLFILSVARLAFASVSGVELAKVFSTDSFSTLQGWSPWLSRSLVLTFALDALIGYGLSFMFYHKRPQPPQKINPMLRSAIRTTFFVGCYAMFTTFITATFCYAFAPNIRFMGCIFILAKTNTMYMDVLNSRMQFRRVTTKPKLVKGQTDLKKSDDDEKAGSVQAQAQAQGAVSEGAGDGVIGANVELGGGNGGQEKRGNEPIQQVSIFAEMRSDVGTGTAGERIVSRSNETRDPEKSVPLE